MTYPSLAAVFLAIAVVGALALPLTRRPRAWPHPGAVVATIVALVVLTAAFDSLMIAAELFHYDQAALAGPHIGLAPIEDFAYPLATAILLPAVWETLRRRRRAAGSGAHDGVASRFVERRDETGPSGPRAREDEA